MSRITSLHRQFLGLIVLAFLSLYGCAGSSLTTDKNESSANSDSESSESNRDVEGKVDRSTYLGWRTFHSACSTCHGTGGTGTIIAPDLVEKIEGMSAERFSKKVLKGHLIIMTYTEAKREDQGAIREAFIELLKKSESGDLTMPAWEKDPNVRPHIKDIYTYLRARADGVIGAGRPEPLFKQ